MLHNHLLLVNNTQIFPKAKHLKINQPIWWHNKYCQIETCVVCAPCVLFFSEFCSFLQPLPSASLLISPPPPPQVVGRGLAAVHLHLWTRRGAEANGALRPHGVRGGKGAPPRRVQRSPQTQTRGAVQQRCALWRGLGRGQLGGGFVSILQYN